MLLSIFYYNLMYYEFELMGEQFLLNLSLFFLMVRRPPRSTLFPYTDALPICPSRSTWRRTSTARTTGAGCRTSRRRRLEEHTSELQSQSNLVCRLLLEKKNQPRPNLLGRRSSA